MNTKISQLPVQTAPLGTDVTEVVSGGVNVQVALANLPKIPFVASGTGHAAGAVPDPGAISGTTRFLREDASFATPTPAVTDIPGLQQSLSPLYPVPHRPQFSLGIPISAAAPTITLSGTNPATSNLTCGMTYTFSAGVNGGNYTLTVGAQTTGNIAWSGTQATTLANVKAALEALSNIGSGGVFAVGQTGQTVRVVFTDSVVTSIKGSSFAAINVSLTGGTMSSFGSLTTYYPLISNTTAGTVDTTHFSFLNGFPIQRDKGFNSCNAVICANTCSTNAVYSPTVEFYHTGAQLELNHFDGGAGYRIFVDDVVVMNNPVTGFSGTAQAGSATSITLAAGASATTGTYVGWDVAITGGTGAGQQKPIIAYFGSTGVATVRGGFGTAPDATSTYEIRPPGAPFLTPGPTGNIQHIPLDFGGVRATRKFTIECAGATLFGINVGPCDSICSTTTRRMRTFVIGNSFDEGTGAWSWTQSLAAIMCNELGEEYWQSAQGGADYVNAGAISSYRLNVLDRLFPPACSWRLNIGNNTSGNFQLTFGTQTTAVLPYTVGTYGFTVNLGTPSAGTYALTVTNGAGSATATVPYNDTASQVQTLLNALSIGGTAVSTTVTGNNGGPYTVSFADQVSILSGDGSLLTGGTFSIPTTLLSALAALSNVGPGNVRVCGANLNYIQILFLNGLASSSNTLSIINSTLASNGGCGPMQFCAPWLGDLIPYVPTDGSGNVLPFNVVFADGLNDNGLDVPTVTTQASTCWSKVQSRFPTANVYVFGPQAPNGTPASTIVALDQSLSARASLAYNGTATGGLKRINGKVPYFSSAISTTVNLFRTGTGTLSAPVGNGDSDYKVNAADPTHPSYFGHEADGMLRASIRRAFVQTGITPST
jgi:hypothetical protein